MPFALAKGPELTMEQRRAMAHPAVSDREFEEFWSIMDALEAEGWYGVRLTWAL